MIQVQFCLLQNKWKSRKQQWMLLFSGPGLYLSWGLDTFPKAEVEDKDHRDQTQGQVPARRAQVVDTPTLVEM